MPIINVKLLEGRTDEQLKNLVTEVTHAVEKTTEQTKKRYMWSLKKWKRVTMQLAE